jgi:CRP-like cAMP-binding protein
MSLAEPPRNHLLRALQPEDLARLLPAMEPIELIYRQTVYRQGETISHVVFPEQGWLSQLIMLEGGDAGEVGLIGREGMAGLRLFFDDDRSAVEVIVQSSGHALRLAADRFRMTVDDSPALRGLLSRYTLAIQQQVSQTAACNIRHVVEQRLGRWLLMAHDRADGDSLQMTHELLSTMLGVRRAGVTVAAGALQRAGLIRYERGVITIVDRAGLEAASCECYRVVRRETTRLLGSFSP